MAGVAIGGWSAWHDEWAERMARCLDHPAAFLDATRRARFAVLRAVFLAELDREDHPLALIHHDLAPEHILVTPDGTRIAGVIDWGDLALGDPALDFAGFASTEHNPRLRTLLAACGAVDPDSPAASPGTPGSRPATPSSSAWTPGTPPKFAPSQPPSPPSRYTHPQLTTDDR